MKLYANMIIECNVWCVLNPENESLGLKTGDTWMPFAIDFNSVVAIKMCGENEFLGSDRATIYFASEVVTIDKSFSEAIEIWRRTRKIVA